jgi:hypothetical protein
MIDFVSVGHWNITVCMYKRESCMLKSFTHFQLEFEKEIVFQMLTSRNITVLRST